MFKFLKRYLTPGNSYSVDCADGSTKTVYKNVNDAFPLFIEGWEGNLSAKLKSETIANGEFKTAYASKIDGLLYALDELNQGLMMTFRAVYVTYSSDPCGNSVFFQREVSRLLDEQRRLRALKIQIDALLRLAQNQHNQSDEFTKLFCDVVQRIGVYPGKDATTQEMKDAAADVKVLLGGAE